MRVYEQGEISSGQKLIYCRVIGFWWSKKGTNRVYENNYNTLILRFSFERKSYYRGELFSATREEKYGDDGKCRKKNLCYRKQEICKMEETDDETKKRVKDVTSAEFSSRISLLFINNDSEYTYSAYVQNDIYNEPIHVVYNK